MDIKPASQINFEYNGKRYCLEYTRETVKQLEGAGFNINDIGDKPATRIEQLWEGAFLAHHKKAIGDGVTMKIYAQIKDKKGLLKKLAEMYNATLAYLLPDEDEEEGNEGNVEWTATA